MLPICVEATLLKLKLFGGNKQIIVYICGVFFNAIPRISFVSQTVWACGYNVMFFFGLSSWNLFVGCALLLPRATCIVLLFKMIYSQI